ncbi:hypothetical protein HOY82DRAFT_578251 [Tuber indicum]|nr:hypothetical protein HOY82DRAFT_578251 [Tuber indicum]
MALNRSLIRNVYFHDDTNPDVTLGGFYRNGSITKANFLDMLKILLIVEGNPLRVQERVSGDILSRTDLPLKKGIYDTYCDGICSFIQVNNEPWIPRSISHNSCGMEDSSCQDDRFCCEVRSRDRRCIISGLIIPEAHIQANNWVGFQAAHIFPPEHESLWTQCDYGQGITYINDTHKIPKIDSCQNGFLGFDQCLISVNLDDNYKIVVFDIDIFGLDGRILDPLCRNPDGPRRAGEPIFEHDFPPGHDMAGEILGPYGRERSALEIASRLRRFLKDNRFRHGETLQLSAK